MSEVNQVILVGHCGFDAGSIQRTVAKADNAVQIKDVAGSDDVQDAGPQSLLLINRQLGRDNGLDLIKRLADKDNPPRMMLVSNHADAQEAAVAAGALPGFGKSELGTDETVNKLRNAIRG